MVNQTVLPCMPAAGITPQSPASAWTICKPRPESSRPDPRADDGIAGTAVADLDTNSVRQSIDSDREMGDRVAHGIGGELRDHHGDRIGRARRHAADGVEHEPTGIADRSRHRSGTFVGRS